MARIKTPEQLIQNQSLNKIMAKHTESQEYVDNWHRNIQKWRRLYNFQHYSKKAKPGESRFPDPTPTNVVDLAVGVFLKNDIEFKAVGWEPDAVEEQEASKIEKYLLGTMERSVEREEYDIHFDVTHKFVRDGAGVLYTVWDPVLNITNRTMMRLPAPDRPEMVASSKVYTQTPVRVQSIDPLKMSMLPGGPRRWLHVFRTEKRSVYDVETEYDVRIDKYADRPMREKMDIEEEYIDYWRIAIVGRPIVNDDGEEVINRVTGQPEVEEGIAVINAVIFAGEFLREPRIMPGYEEIPYTIGFYKPSDRDDPSKWWGVLRPLETSIKFLEYAVNRRMKQIDVYSGLPMVVKSAPGRSIQIDPGFHNVKKISLEEDIAFPKWPGNAPDVERHINYLRSRLQQAGFSDVMYGMGSASGEAATFAIQQLADQNRIRLEQPARQLAMMWTIWARKVMDMTSKFARESYVRVYGRKQESIFATQLYGREAADYLVKAKIQPEMPGASIRKHSMATQVKDILSEHTLMERYLDIEQPDDERKRRLVDRALNHPAMQLYGVVRQLMKLQDRGNIAAGIVLRQIQQGNAGGSPIDSGGRPTEPTNPEQRLGLGTPTGEPQPQEAGGLPPGQSVMEQQRRGE